MDSSGTRIWTYSFGSSGPENVCSDGCYPSGPIIQASDGNFYGTTQLGGNNNFGNWGTVYRISPAGVLMTIYSFCAGGDCNDGQLPQSGVIQGMDGYLYGTASAGGSAGDGSVFKMTLSGTLVWVYSFCTQRNCTDGIEPTSGLVQAADGNFYGTTQGYGLLGTIFKITTSGTLTTLHTSDGTDGDNLGSLVQGTDGYLYGTSSDGGTYDLGTVFKISPNSPYPLTILHSFGNGSDGAGPIALLQGTDGNLYGTTSTVNGGTVFEMSPAPPYTLSTLYRFCTQGDSCPDGSDPEAGLFEARDGSFYGTTYTGGGNDSCDGHLGTCGTIFRLSGPAPIAVQFVPVTPCRLADTRETHTPIQGGTWQTFVVPQLGDCNVPMTASAYSLNVTVVPHEPLGYLTVWPTGEAQPTVSTMNSLDARTKANAAIVPAGASGAVSVFASNTTDLVLDIDGYFAPTNAQTYEFYPLAPCRVIDTRNANGDLGGPFLIGGEPRNFPVLESPCIPANANAQAYSFNFTAVPHAAGQPLGYLTVWPQGGSQPGVSTLNNPTATTVANAAIVPAGTGGGIAVFASNNTDLVVDINGYFAAPGTGGLSLYPVAPCRVLDTRSVGNGNPFSGTLVVNVTGSICAPPSSAQAYVFNATVVPSGALGYLTLWPDGQGQPVVSTLNALDGFVTSNMAIVPTTNGSIDAYASNLTQLVLDISSYFAP